MTDTTIRPANSGGTWEPSSEKLFSLRKSLGPDDADFQFTTLFQPPLEDMPKKGQLS